MIKQMGKEYFILKMEVDIKEILGKMQEKEKEYGILQMVTG